MRLINADALEKTLRDWIRDYWTDAFTGDDAGSEFLDMIEHAKNIDSAPVVHAHWDEDDYGFYSCSACGYEWDESEYYTNYCPDCGAKMDEEEEK